MTLTEQDRKALVNVRLQNAKATLEDARKLFNENSMRGAVNRAYYSMFYAVSALAIYRGWLLKD